MPPRAQAQPQVQADGQQPNVRFERAGEAQVVYQPGDGGSVRPIGPATARAAPLAAQRPADRLRTSSAASVSPKAPTQLNSDQRGYATASAADPSAATPGRRHAGTLPNAGMQAVKVRPHRPPALQRLAVARRWARSRVLIGDTGPISLLPMASSWASAGIALSTDRITYARRRLFLGETLIDEQIRSLPEFKESANFRVMDRNQTHEPSALAVGEAPRGVGSAPAVSLVRAEGGPCGEVR